MQACSSAVSDWLLSVGRLQAPAGNWKRVNQGSPSETSESEEGSWIRIRETPSPCRELKKVESRITIRKWKRIRIRQTPGPCRELKKGQSRIRDQDHGDSRPLLETEKGRIKDYLKTKHWETPGACRKMKMSELGIRNRKRINQGFGSEMKPRKTTGPCWKLRLCWRLLDL